MVPIRALVFPVQTVSVKTARVSVPLDMLYLGASTEVKLMHMEYLLLYNTFY